MMLSRMTARGFIDVQVSRFFPYQSTDPERPGTVHWAYDEQNRVLYCSRAAFDQLKNLPDEHKDQLMFAMGALP